MAKSVLVTTSLFGSIDWFNSMRTKKALDDLIGLLSRESYDAHPNATRGIEFENVVYHCLKGNPQRGGTKIFNDIVNRLQSDRVHSSVKGKKFITIDGVRYCIYGKADIMHYDQSWKPVHIIDIKTSDHAPTPDKYLSTAQHHFYCYIFDVLSFEYFVVQFDHPQDGRPSNRIVDYKIFDYHAKSIKEEEDLLISKLTEVIHFFDENPALKKLWHETYSLY